MSPVKMWGSSGELSWDGPSTGPASFGMWPASADPSADAVGESGALAIWRWRRGSWKLMGLPPRLGSASVGVGTVSVVGAEAVSLATLFQEMRGPGGETALAQPTLLFWVRECVDRGRAPSSSAEWVAG
jgi:hypothetical protein